MIQIAEEIYDRDREAIHRLKDCQRSFPRPKTDELELKGFAVVSFPG